MFAKVLKDAVGDIVVEEFVEAIFSGCIAFSIGHCCKVKEE